VKNNDIIYRESVLGALRSKAEQLFYTDADKRHPEGGDRTAQLLHELEIYELELQLQNEELRASYATLEMERLKFVSLFNTAPVGYLILDARGMIQEINETGSQLLYNQGAGIRGKALKSFIVDDSQHAYTNFVEGISKTDDRLQCEVRLKTKKTETRYVQLNGIKAPNTDNGQQPLYITITDVTHAKRNEQELWETTERLNQTLKVSLTGTWMVKSKGESIFLDEYSKNILDVRDHAAFLPWKALVDIFVEEDRPKLNALFANCDDDNEIDLELRLIKANGNIKTILVKGKSVNPVYGSSYYAGIMTDITDRKRNLQLREETEDIQRRLLRRAAIEAQEKERDNLSAALHNSVCQILYGIRFNVSQLAKQESFKSHLDGINSLLDQAIREVRTISVELTPSILKDFGFVAGIKDMTDRLGRAGFKVTTSIDQRADQLPEETQLYLFRIVQELLNNSIKHSGTNSASVSLCAKNGEVDLTVSDAGRGLSSQLNDALKKGSGLRGIKNRVQLLNGTMTIEDAEGITFKIHLPKGV